MQEINDKTILWDEQIDKFLSKSMTSEEEINFLNQINSDKEMKDYVSSVTLLINKLREEGETHDTAFRDAVSKTTKRDLYTAMGKKQQSAIIVKLSPIFAIAACACAFFGNSYLLKTNTIEFAESTGMGQIGPSRGEGIEIPPVLIENVNNNKDLPSTIQQLNELFTSLPEEDSSEYRTVGWYLALAHIKEGNTEEAKDVLQQVITVCPDFKEAWELRDRLARTFFWQ